MNSLLLPPAAQVQADQPLESPDEIGQIHRAAAGRQRQDLPAIGLPALEEVFLLLAFPDYAFDEVAVAAPQIGDLEVAAGDRAGKDAAGEVVLADLALPGGDHVADAAHALPAPHRLTNHAHFRAVEPGRAHHVHGRRDHHVHV